MSTITIDGADLFYRESGSGAPLLLIHGTGANADIWGHTFDDLAATHRVIAYDRRGYSRSASPPVKDLHRHAEDAAALLRQLQAVSATVLGASVGGIIALTAHMAPGFSIAATFRIVFAALPLIYGMALGGAETLPARYLPHKSTSARTDILDPISSEE